MRKSTIYTKTGLQAFTFDKTPEDTTMKYAVYFKWNDGFEDSFNVENAKDRDFNIKDMIQRKDFKEISYCRIYANGEYGIEVKVL